MIQVARLVPPMGQSTRLYSTNRAHGRLSPLPSLGKGLGFRVGSLSPSHYRREVLSARTTDPTLIRRATPKMRAKKPIRLNSNDA